MKYLFLILCLFSCQKSKKGSLEVSSQSPLSTRTSVELNSKLDLMIAFWWPKEMQKNESKLVEKIIAISKKISENKDNFSRKNKNLDCRYEKLDCLCHLDYICENESTEPSDEIAIECISLQESKQKLSTDFDIFSDTLHIKKTLLEFNQPGTWIPTFIEFDYNETPFISTKDKIIDIPFWGNETTRIDQSNSIIHDIKPNFLSFSFLENNRRTLFKIDLKDKEQFIQGVGEIELIDSRSQEILKSGVIYFEAISPSNSINDCSTSSSSSK